LKKLFHSVRKIFSEEWPYLRGKAMYMLNRKRLRGRTCVRKGMIMLSVANLSPRDVPDRSYSSDILR
jgi:hypothetical protein